MKNKNLETDKNENETEALLAHINIGEPKLKRKTITKRGHSISVNTTVQYRKKRTERVYGRVPFSRSFWKEFKHLFPHNNSNHQEEEKLPAGLSNFINGIIFKYGEYYSPAAWKEQREFAHELSKRFLSTENFNEINITDENRLDYCKSLIEYGFFLKSIHGDKASPARIRDFIDCLNENNCLDAEKLQKKANSLEETFKEIMDNKSDSSPRYNPAKFDRFIMYKIIPYLNRGEIDIVKRRITCAKTTLEEAITKYSITESNIAVFLKLVLQHLEWGITQAKNIKLAHNLSEKLQIYASEEEKAMAAKIPDAEKLYLVKDVFKMLKIKDNILKFHALNDSSALPVITKRNNLHGYFVTEEGLEKVLNYLELNKAFDYKILRGNKYGL